LKGKINMLFNAKKQAIGCMILLVLSVAGTSAVAVADNDELEVMRREMKQLRQQVQELQSEFRRLKDDKKKDKDVTSEYQQELQEIRDDHARICARTAERHLRNPPTCKGRTPQVTLKFSQPLHNRHLCPFF
jgi:septal ring factor EnvC (AmiA/AmiB activator)